MQRILMNIAGIKVKVVSEWSEILQVLEMDFWSFRLEEGQPESVFDLAISIYKTNDKPNIPEISTSMQTQNSLSYDVGSVRYNDYYGQAYTVVDFKTEKAEIYGLDFDKIHEIAYLLILSRAGKMLDLRGLHKLHAFAVTFNDIAFVCMMPSKGGKSTLLSELLIDDRIKMLSDDIPLVDSNGRIHPFCLKIGFNEIPANLKIVDPEINIYSMKRALYGEKKLVCTRGVEDKIYRAHPINRVLLVEGFRYNSELSKVVPSSWAESFIGLLKHGIIGVGSPIVVEYFWESGLVDFLKKTRIFFKRLRAFTILSFSAKKYKLFIGRDQKRVARAVIELLEKQSTIK